MAILFWNLSNQRWYLRQESGKLFLPTNLLTITGYNHFTWRATAHFGPVYAILILYVHKELPEIMIRRINQSLTLFTLRLRSLLSDERGELDEKAILIAFFVIIVAAAVVLLGQRVGDMFRQLAGMV